MRRSAASLSFLVALVGSCARFEVGRVETTATVPTIRVALAVNARTVEIGGGRGSGSALLIREPDGRVIGRIPAGVRARADLAADGRVVIQVGGGSPFGSELPTLVPDGDGTVDIGRSAYRGSVAILPGSSGLTAVNHLPVEEYLLGVVNAEMGRRGTREGEALKAQAVVSRTVALRAIERWRERSYDVLATVSDQAYGGVEAELSQSFEAVQNTAGQILTYRGRVIEAFFGSTCGGRTASGAEVFSGARGLGYLPAQSDTDPSGKAWCSISPRFRWTESWSGDELVAILRTSLPHGRGRGLTAESIRDVVVTQRSPSGRVDEVAVDLGNESVRVEQGAVRRTLHPVGEQLLRSLSFRLVSTRNGTRLIRLEADGGGAGHGVGMCQWGAVGRARAGFNYGEILAAYFPGTDLSRAY